MVKRKDGKSHQEVVNQLPSRLQKHNSRTNKYDLLCVCGATVSAKNWKRHAHKKGAHDCRKMYAKYYEQNEMYEQEDLRRRLEDMTAKFEAVMKKQKESDERQMQLERIMGPKVDIEKMYRIQQELTFDPPLVGEAAVKEYNKEYTKPYYNKASLRYSARKAEPGKWYRHYLLKRFAASDNYYMLFYKVVRDKKGKPFQCVIGDSAPIRWGQFVRDMFMYLRCVATKLYQEAKQNSFPRNENEAIINQMTFICDTRSPARTDDKKWPDPWRCLPPEDDSYMDTLGPFLVDCYDKSVLSKRIMLEMKMVREGRLLPADCKYYKCTRQSRAEDEKETEEIEEYLDRVLTI